jgi:hypothetical protein
MNVYILKLYCCHAHAHPGPGLDGGFEIPPASTYATGDCHTGTTLNNETLKKGQKIDVNVDSALFAFGPLKVSFKFEAGAPLRQPKAVS